MHRFFSPSENISGNKIIITDKAALHHIRDVLRLKQNEPVIVFDDAAKEYDCSVGKISPEFILNIKGKRPPLKDQKICLNIACAIPKKSKLDDIIDKLTQIGVDRIMPLLTERVIVKLDKDKEKSRLKRWEKIAKSASEQCARNSIPVIDLPQDIKEALRKSAGFDLKLIPTLSGKRKSLKEALADAKPKNIMVFIGPEGDFTEKEVGLAREAGFIPVSLGDLVLRVETAAIAVASFIRLNENR